MSNIYIQEPPTTGKVLVVTTVGDIDVELWSKETPKACRNFIQLCLEGYYNDTLFHRIVKDFIVQGGDPTGTGEGGESVYGKPFRDEIHSRLRFVRRGLVAMANGGKDDNGSQFFFTLGATPELQGKHTIFGKVAGNTVYNMLKLGDMDVGENERPTQPAKIIRTEVLANPFEDIVPRSLPAASNQQQESSTTASAKRSTSSRATKDFKLLSFGEEAAEDEEETTKAAKVMKVKGKSAHDVLVDDPHLSAVPAVDPDADVSMGGGNVRSTADSQSGSEDDGDGNSGADSKSLKKKLVASVKQKLKGDTAASKNSAAGDEPRTGEASSKRDELRREVKRLQQELFASKRKAASSDDEAEPEGSASAEPENELVVAYKSERKQYSDVKSKQPRKGAAREALTLAMLDKFRTKLETVKKLSVYDEADDVEKPSDAVSAAAAASGKTKSAPSDDEEEDPTDSSWLSHELRFDANTHKVLDANVHDVDRYELYDPRNPLNQRRRESSKQSKRPEPHI